MKFKLKYMVKEDLSAEDKNSIENMTIYYPSTTEEKQSLIKKQDDILNKISNISKYLYQYVILDLDDKRIIGSAKTLREISAIERNLNSLNQTLSLKITKKKLGELKKT